VLRPPGKPGGLFSGARGVVNAGSTGVTWIGARRGPAHIIVARTWEIESTVRARRAAK